MTHHPQPVLSRLRNDTTLCDAVLVCGDDKIRVHACVISQISPFFVAAWTGQFKEADSRSIFLGDTTTRAVRVLLDYAYEVEYVKALGADYELTVEVWALAHLYSVDTLQSAVEKEIIAHTNTDNIVDLIHLSKRYESKPSVVNVLIEFAARHFSSLDSKLLTGYELEKILISTELIATEWARISAVKNWCDGKDDQQALLTRLVGCLNFELLERSELYKLFDGGAAWIPRDALVEVIKSGLRLGIRRRDDLKICTHCKFMCTGYGCCDDGYHYNDLKSGCAVSMDITIPSLNGKGVFDPAASPVYCRIRNFVFCIRPLISENKTLYFFVSVVRRWSNNVKKEAGTVSQSLKGTCLFVWGKVVGNESKYLLSTTSGKDKRRYFAFDSDSAPMKLGATCHMTITLIVYNQDSGQ